ncbi:hypothetical protein [Ralstonia syzygii]|uniref:hypothetical protein n=1 Tax=Ralstonia syzygii TaxID=28097 RepID=UPI0035184028
MPVATLGAQGWQIEPPQVERLRVDEEPIGFWAGKMFRAYYEFSIAAGGNRSFRFISPINFILTSQRLDVDDGGVRMAAYTGTITPSGSWTPVPQIGVNRSTERPLPGYTNQCTIETGGTFTGGTEVDVLRARGNASGGLLGSGVNVGQAHATERALPAGTYYIRLDALAGVAGTSLGIYSISWEERP